MSLTPDQIEYQLVNIQDDVQPNIYVACSICLLSTYLAVILRFVSRRLKHAPLGGDDYTIIVALVRYSPFIKGNICILIKARFSSSRPPSLGCASSVGSPKPNIHAGRKLTIHTSHDTRNGQACHPYGSKICHLSAQGMCSTQ